jgi:ketosteroid isomerase-like protein
MKRLLATVFMLSGLAVSPQYAVAQAADSNDKAHIERVIETFRAAIVNKDEDAFLRLFLKEDITWTGVTTDASIERMYANRPKLEMKRPFKFFNSSPRKFISAIVKDKEKVDETISNVRIDSDGDVGLVWFDYSFVSGSYKENWGKESWQMVRTNDGWKIAGVVWSQELNPTPPPSAVAQ